MARKVLHLKSTNGVPVMGFAQMTAAVVDELALLPFSVENLAFDWPSERPQSPGETTRGRAASARTNPNVLVAPSVQLSVVQQIEASGRKVHQMEVHEASARFVAYDRAHPPVPAQAASDVPQLHPDGSPLPRFDLAVVGVDVNARLQGRAFRRQGRRVGQFSPGWCRLGA